MFLDACPPSSCPLLSLQFSPAPSGPRYPSFQSIQPRSRTTPPRAEPAGSANPICTAYSSFSKSDSLFIHIFISSPFFTTHATHMPAQFIQLLHQADTLVLKEQAKTRRDVFTRRWRQLAASSLGSHQPLRTEKAEPPS